jgi:hypothetical protein
VLIDGSPVPCCSDNKKTVRVASFKDVTEALIVVQLLA